MRKNKMVFLLGIMVLSMFLLIPQPTKAETEIVPIYSEED